MMTRVFAAMVALVTMMLGTLAHGEEELPAYKTVPGISGNLVGVGSDTLNNSL